MKLNVDMLDMELADGPNVKREDLVLLNTRVFSDLFGRPEFIEYKEKNAFKEAILKNVENGSIKNCAIMANMYGLARLAFKDRSIAEFNKWYERVGRGPNSMIFLVPQPQIKNEYKTELESYGLNFSEVVEAYSAGMNGIKTIVANRPPFIEAVDKISKFLSGKSKYDMKDMRILYVQEYCQEQKILIDPKNLRPDQNKNITKRVI